MSSSTDNDIEQLPTAKIDENVTYLFPTHNVHLALCELFSELETPCLVSNGLTKALFQK